MHMWPGTYNAHLSHQYIKELGEFIQVRFTKEIAHPGNTLIVFSGLLYISQVIHNHCPEFQAFKTLTPTANPTLNKENRSRRVELYEQCYNGK